MAGEIKGIYDSMPDKNVLDKYYKSPVYFYHSLYFIGFKAGLIESPDFDKSEIDGRKMADILENIESAAIKAFEGKDGIQDYVMTMMELGAVKEGLKIISKVEDEEDTEYGLNKIPQEVRAAIFPCLYDKESYFLESNRREDDVISVKIRHINKDKTEEIREYNFRKEGDRYVLF